VAAGGGRSAGPFGTVRLKTRRKVFFKIEIVIKKTPKFYQQTKERKKQMAVKENENEGWNL
jgi:hypothetical protein